MSRTPHPPPSPLSADNTTELLAWCAEEGLAQKAVMFSGNHYRLTPFGQDVSLLLFSLLGNRAQRKLCQVIAQLPAEP